MNGEPMVGIRTDASVSAMSNGGRHKTQTECGRSPAGNRPLRDWPEEEIVTLARNGDRGAFSELVHRNERYLKRLAYTMVGNPVTVDDIVAECFLKAFAHLDQFVARARFSSWLRRIVTNECCALARSERRRDFVSIEDAELFPGGIAHQVDVWNPEEQLARQELLVLLSQEIARIPPMLRTPLLLYLQERSMRDIAAETGLSEPAVKARLIRAREHLTTRFRRHLPVRHPFCSF